MGLSANDFGAYFEAVNGYQPFAWQRRLLDTILESARWPDSIVAPTGAGKSSVVDVHVFVTALSAIGAAPRLPRRMAVVVNRRALVDKHLARARSIAHHLDNAGESILGDVRDALLSLTDGPTALLTTSLRGGLEASERRGLAEWIDDPRMPAVIAATPDMWGSRLLFRGYGCSRLAWPREAGMMALDSVMILDEAHLNRQLLATARDVATLVARDGAALGVPGLQVVETTATPTAATDGRSRISVEERDLAEPIMRKRMRAAKTAIVVESDAVPAKMPPTAAYLGFLASQALELAGETVDAPDRASTVLCVVNNVATAEGLAAKLRLVRRPDEVLCWVGRMRPMDAERLPSSVFTPEGDKRVRFLVATQTVEVGIDLDCAALLTELAPRSALVQRFGRVNRTGERSAAPIRVVVPPVDKIADRPPYGVEDLRTAHAWLAGIGGCDVSPWSLTGQDAPVETVRRQHLSAFAHEHAELLAFTSEELFEEPDLRFWLHDDLDDDNVDPVGVVIREMLSEDERLWSMKYPEGTLRQEDLAIGLLEATPPDAREVFPVAPRRVRQLVEMVLDAEDLCRVFLWREGLMRQVDRDRLSNDEELPRPGDTVILDAWHARRGVGFLRGIDPDDLMPAAAWGPDGVEVVFPYNDRDGWCELLVGLDAEDAQRVYAERTGTDNQVVLPPAAIVGDAARLPWLVLKPAEVVAGDVEVRQEWTTRDGVVLLNDHQSAVAGEASRWGRSLGLPDRVVAALEMAGLHHDDGKQDVRFQRERLRADGTTGVLAKSESRSAQQVRRRRTQSELPSLWRHEQLSAAYVWTSVPEEADRDLVARLAGTSHGRGRPFFPHGLDGLLGGRPDPTAGAVRSLFATGGEWSGLLTRTEREWGIWGCAYLEAVLRGADCRVSRDGS